MKMAGSKVEEVVAMCDTACVAFRLRLKERIGMKNDNGHGNTRENMNRKQPFLL